MMELSAPWDTEELNLVHGAVKASPAGWPCPARSQAWGAPAPSRTRGAECRASVVQTLSYPGGSGSTSFKHFLPM